MEAAKTVGLFYHLAYQKMNETIHNLRANGLHTNHNHHQKSIKIDSATHPFRVKKEVFEKLLREIPTDECPVFGCTKKKAATWPTCFSCNVISQGNAPRDINTELVKKGSAPLLDPKPRPTFFREINLRERVFNKVFGKIKYEEFDSRQELIANISSLYPGFSQEEIREIIIEAEERLKESGWIPKRTWNYLFDEIAKEFKICLSKKGDLPPPDKIFNILRMWLPQEETSFRKEIGERVARAVINHLKLQPIRYKL